MIFFEGWFFWGLFIPGMSAAGLMGVYRPAWLRRFIFPCSLVFVLLIYGARPQESVNLVIFLVFGYGLISVYGRSLRRCPRAAVQTRRRLLHRSVAAGLIPITLNLGLPLFGNGLSWGFQGVVFLHFRVLQFILEMHDEVIDQPTLSEYLKYMLFFSTMSRGPIDRSRRFLEDLETEKTRRTFLHRYGKGIGMMFLGGVYLQLIVPRLAEWMRLLPAEHTLWREVLYMYLFGFRLFFDLAGYSLFAVGSARLMGIAVPKNFNKPFLARNPKEFWHRWHLGLSYWFRDYVFLRMVRSMRWNLRFHRRVHAVMTAYVISMFLLGIWHGLTADFALYGIYHGILMAATEWIQHKSSWYRNNHRKKWFHVLAVVGTFHMIMFGFFIYSGAALDVLRAISRAR